MDATDGHVAALKMKNMHFYSILWTEEISLEDGGKNIRKETGWER